MQTNPLPVEPTARVTQDGSVLRNALANQTEPVKTNPNGANQYQLDPRQKLCWDFYVDPKSDTFSNGYQSAVKAGYTDESAQRITAETWFSERLSRLNMLDKAERNLDEFLDMPVLKMGSDKDKAVIVTDPQLLKIKQDTTKFVAETVGKERYSKRSELTGKDGGALFDLTSVLDGLDGEKQKPSERVEAESDPIYPSDLGVVPAED